MSTTRSSETCSGKHCTRCGSRLDRTNRKVSRPRLIFYLLPRLQGMTTLDHAPGGVCARRSPVAPPPMRSSGRPRLLPRSALRPRGIVAPSEFACSVDRTRVDVSDSGRISQNVHGDCVKGEGSRETGTTHNPFAGPPSIFRTALDSFICGPYKD
jgi:hypothetical protein